MILRLDIELLRTLDEVRDFMTGSAQVAFGFVERVPCLFPNAVLGAARKARPHALRRMAAPIVALKRRNRSRWEATVYSRRSASLG